jgi:hypothetical protein
MGKPQRTTSDLLSLTQPQSRLERRKKAAALLEAVLDETIEARIAINRWPESLNSPDPSLDCAYLALWHFEADETQQKTEVFYMDAQLELLRQIVNHLEAGRELPPHILRIYIPTRPVRFYYPGSVWAATQRYVLVLWRKSQHTFSLAWALLHPH